MGTVEAKKAALVQKAATLAAQLFEPEDQASVSGFIARFYEHVPPSDVAERTPRNLYAAALSLWRFGERRRLGQAKVRVHNPDPATDGWSSPHTIVEIVNDDMPFLVDSVTGAINAGSRVVHLIIHPILTVDRGPDGRLRDILKPGDAGNRESWMQIETTAESDPADLARLTQTLSGVLADVRAAVSDWQPMREVLREVAADLSANPPPVPVGQLAEAQDFLRWLDDDNFTFLGYREYLFDSDPKPQHAPLGILRDASHPVFGGLRALSSLPPDVQEFVRRRELLVISKSNRRATVHRTAHMDTIGVRCFGANGEVTGIRLFLGLFTSLAYSRNPRSIPLLRLKVRRILERSGFPPTSHDGKALLHVLDTFPRDELFQADAEELFETVTGILNLQERQRIAVFVRRDPLERFVSCFVFVPRERYDSELRARFGAILETAFAGSISAFNTHLDDSALARIHFIIRTARGAVPKVDTAALEAKLVEAGRSWTDRLRQAASAAYGEDGAHDRLRRVQSFPIGYQARTDAAQAVADLRRIDAVAAGSPLEVSLHPAADGSLPGLRIYRTKEPVALSDVLPMLENLGPRVVAEEPFRIDRADGPAVWIHEFQLSGIAILSSASPVIRARFEEALVAVWTGRVEDDGFNRLVLAAGLSARQVTVLRLYAKFLRQVGTTFSQAYMEDALGSHPDIARRLINLFELRFDPERAESSLACLAEIQAIDHALDEVTSLDEDRILRMFLTLVLRSVRTNYFQILPSGEAKPYLAVKLASGDIDFLPLPRPLFEIYVYSPRVEGVHMRAGKVARGGIRWSDRKEDFRTEILGLMKAQTVKNAVIVPVGSKGGFVVKRPPQLRDNLSAEAVECYKTLIRSLLDLTDNIVSEEPGRHRVVPPPRVVRHDNDDPYLVVAADKGTATFSDFANAISEEYGFWLGDAFASGGSAGYDHKEMGITARGAWELVKRHFRELGRNIESSEITVIGVGDMSGDVFGNGMLMSRHLRLLGAFDHRHIFIDPDPQAESSFAERMRLFRLPRSSWADYDRGLISPGGGVFERSLKSISITPEMKRAFNIEADHLTPAELIRKLLTAPVDLLWFGGIGTYVKSPGESHADAGDRANDALRVNGDEIRAKVVGEGANLAVTQRGRIVFALAGGRIDTDAIDNSAGVDTSDHEVNIKILLDQAIASKALFAAERQPLLAEMSGEVAALVLRDNHLQGQALSGAEARGIVPLDCQLRMIRDLERTGRLDRALEFLPDDESLAARSVQQGQGLVRPELAVLLAYAKLTLYEDLLASPLPDLPELGPELLRYFPQAVRSRFEHRIALHPLHREIIATVVANEVINRARITFVHDMRARTGRPPAEVTQAYLIVRELFELEGLWAAIEALDNKVAAQLQTEMLLEIADLIERTALWLLFRKRLAIGAETGKLMPSVRRLSGGLFDLLPPSDRTLVSERRLRFAEAGAPKALAARIGETIFLAAALDIADLAEHSGQPLERTARVYYEVGSRFALDDIRVAARRLRAETPWQKQAVEATIDDVFSLQTDLVARILAGAGAEEPDPIAAWAPVHARALTPAEPLLREIRAAINPDLAMLVVAGRQLRHALD